MRSMANHTRHFFILLIFLLVPLILPQNSGAAQISFVIEGYLDYVAEELSNVFEIGDLYHLEYTFDSAAPDVSPDISNRGSYVDAISLLSITVGSYSAVWSGNGMRRISVYNNAVYDTDVYFDGYGIFLSKDFLTGETINGYSLTHQSQLLSLTEFSANAFSDDALVTEALDLSIFSGYMGLKFYNPDVAPTFQIDGIQATITSFQVNFVPVPSSCWILLAGLAGLLGFFRKIA